MKLDGLLAYREPLADLDVCHPFDASERNLSLSTTQVAVAHDALNCPAETCRFLISLYLFRVGQQAKRATALENLFGPENLVEVARARALTFFGLRALDAQFAKESTESTANRRRAIDARETTQASDGKVPAGTLDPHDFREHGLVHLILKRSMAEREQSHIMTLTRRAKKLTGRVGQAIRQSV